MEITPGVLLRSIDSPDDLKKLDENQLQQVCSELRQYIIDVVSVYGGHFAASLGVVELTVALHYVYNTPYDQLVWDVGHQAYGHKILTGRRDNFTTNRRYKGLSGFPKRSESAYDAFGVGHSSTSVSAALGMAMASHLKGEKDRKHIAVIGDGALSAGMAFEGLNNAGSSNADVLIILNDNSISIDPNVSALEKYLKRIATEDQLGKRCDNIFESLGIHYTGPVDGHNLDQLIETLTRLKSVAGPKLLHIKTVKGKGFAPAEKNQTQWHATGAFDNITGIANNQEEEGIYPLKYQDVFGQTLSELVQTNQNIVAVTPAMLSGSGLKMMMDTMPDRVFDVGICEQHAVTLSAGMATQGLKVFCTIYSTFMQRAYDQVIHDVAIQNLPVIFCLDRAGLTGKDGPTHHGAYDIAYMRCIPNMIISAPMNESELRNLMFTAQLDETKHPFVIRYPRGKGVLKEWKTSFKKIEIGRGRELRSGKGVAVLSFGHPGNFVAEAIEQVKLQGINPAHYDMRFAKPLDEELLHKIFKTFKKIITIEDGTVAGGFGSAVLEFMNLHHYQAEVKILGIPDRLIEHGSQEQLYEETGIDARHIAEALIEMGAG